MCAGAAAAAAAPAPAPTPPEGELEAPDAPTAAVADDDDKEDEEEEEDVAKSTTSSRLCASAYMARHASEYAAQSRSLSALAANEAVPACTHTV